MLCHRPSIPTHPLLVVCLTDIITHLNALNVKLQGKYIPVTTCTCHIHMITPFEVKLRLAACVPDDVEPDTCVSVGASLREEYASRFTGVRPLAADFRLFTAPFDFPADGVG